MNCDCHIHMVLDGQDWKAAIAAHREAPNDAIIRSNLRRWQAAGITYLREGGDRWGSYREWFGLYPYEQNLQGFQRTVVRPCRQYNEISSFYYFRIKRNHVGA